MKRITTILLSSTLMLTLGACNKKHSDDSTKVAERQNEAKFVNANNEKDTEFAVAAADGGMLEVQLGQLAQTNGTSSKVKEFGKSMIQDHSKANDELKALAQQKNITLPQKLSDKNQKKYNDLSEKRGTEFDKAYTKFMVDDHEDDIDEFKKEAEKGDDAEIKSWASGKVTTLEHHLEMAKEAKDVVHK
jgi:putative membrane protein